MPITQSPTVRHRELARTLKNLRIKSGLSQEEVAHRVQYSKSKMTRLENAQSGITPRDLKDLLDVYGVKDPAERERIEKLAREARRKGWWTRYANSIDSAYAAYIALESDASEIYDVETALIPGLLQTPSYTEAVIRMQDPEASQEAIDTQVMVRQERRKILARSTPPRLWMVLNEGILHHQVGSPEVLVEQLDFLLAASRETNISLQILPRESPLNVCLYGPFVIMSFPNTSEPEVIYTDTTKGTMYYEEPSDTEIHTALFRRLNVASCDEEKSRALIVRAMKETEKV